MMPRDLDAAEKAAAKRGADNGPQDDLRLTYPFALISALLALALALFLATLPG
jgi:hypothetical protein